MAENNRNSSSQNWDSRWEQNRNRFRDENSNQENYGAYGNAGFREDRERNRDFDDYGGQQSNSWQRGNQYNQDYENRQRVHYTPDNDNNPDKEHGWNTQRQDDQWRQRGNRGWQQQNWDQEGDRRWQRSSNRNDAKDNQDWERNRGSYNYDSKQWAGGTYEGNQGSRYGYEGRDYGNDRYDNDDQRYNNRFRKEDTGSWTGEKRDRTDSWLEQRRHEGQRGAYSGKGPRGYQRSKERIHEDVCDRLTYDDRLDASEIDVKVDENEVILSGTVTTREEKRRAEDIAESIPGVRNVQNRLRIAPPDVGTTETTNTIIRKAGNMPDNDAEKL